MDIFKEVAPLVRWLGCQPMFKANPAHLEFHKLLKEPDETKLTEIIEGFGGIRALEIRCYGAPISALLGCGYAPGQYMGTCCDCKETFIGDKRAVTCLPCAVKSYEALSDN